MLFKVFPLLIQLPLQVVNHGSKLGIPPPISPGLRKPSSWDPGALLSSCELFEVCAAGRWFCRRAGSFGSCSLGAPVRRTVRTCRVRLCTIGRQIIVSECYWVPLMLTLLSLCKLLHKETRYITIWLNMTSSTVSTRTWDSISSLPWPALETTSECVSEFRSYTTQYHVSIHQSHVVRQATGRRINFAFIRSCKPNCATYGITGTNEI